MQSLYRELEGIVGAGHIWKEEPMRKHTTFRIGGPADILAAPPSEEGIRAVLEVCRREGIPLHIIGNGSNLLVSDRGIRGVVLQIFKNYSGQAFEGDLVTAKAGTLLGVLAKQALAHGLSGLEFASGIPGTLGGAVMMNAGAYGGEMKNILQWAKVLTAGGEIRTLGVDELEMGYRTSIVEKRRYTILEAGIRLEEKDPAQILSRMEELKEMRVSKQPLDIPSAGSTFKRPEGYFAGKLIMDAGLRGYSCGDAQVSEKHCGFVVNKGNAAAGDVMELIRRVQKIVFEKYGVALEPEIRMIGEFDEAGTE